MMHLTPKLIRKSGVNAYLDMSIFDLPVFKWMLALEILKIIGCFCINMTLYIFFI